MKTYMEPIDITKHIKVGDKVRYKGQIIEVMRFSKIDRQLLKDTDQLYKNNKLYAEKANDVWQLVLNKYRVQININVDAENPQDAIIQAFKKGGFIVTLLKENVKDYEKEFNNE